MSPKFKITSDRPLSWSAISSFRYSKEQWFDKYILGKFESSKEMEFGSRVGKLWETDTNYLPEIPRHSVMEYSFLASINDLPIIGYADSFCGDTNRALTELKTGKKKWTQDRVDKHQQIDMYCLMNLLQNGVPPEEVDITLAWLPTREHEGRISFTDPFEVKLFKTKRTTEQVIVFGIEVEEIYKQMQEYVVNHS